MIGGKKSDFARKNYWGTANIYNKTRVLFFCRNLSNTCLWLPEKKVITRLHDNDGKFTWLPSMLKEYQVRLRMFHWSSWKVEIEMGWVGRFQLQLMLPVSSWYDPDGLARTRQSTSGLVFSNKNWMMASDCPISMGTGAEEKMDVRESEDLFQLEELFEALCLAIIRCLLCFSRLQPQRMNNFLQNIGFITN